MKKTFSRVIFTWIILANMLSSCGEDRSVEYYTLVATKTWIYEVMLDYYLFYEDIPEESSLDFFDSPQDFLESAASDKDKKNSVLFSHVDSVTVGSRTTSTYPCFGFEAALVRTDEGTNTMRILYVQPDSPASEAGLKRGDWVIAVDSAAISQSTYYSAYVERPSSSHTFTLGKYNPYVEDEEQSDDYDYIEFDTLGTVQLSAPRYVEEQDVLVSGIIEEYNALYVLYNEFGEDTSVLESVFSEANGQVDNVILDLRYNPGGYVSTSQVLGTILAPQSAMGQTFVNMIYNDKINNTVTLNFDTSILSSGSSFQYNNLYIITSESTASASEVIINCLRPYMSGKIIQVGTATYGKNVAQQLFTNEDDPYIELWLTTAYLSNCEGYYDYYDDGLLPDFEIEEDLEEDLGEFGTESDQLLYPVLYHISHGSFPTELTDDETSQSGAKRLNAKGKVLDNSLSHKKRLSLWRQQ